MTELTNLTRKLDRRDREHGTRYHVIYMCDGTVMDYGTPRKEDFCREDAPSCIRTYDAAIDWAKAALYTRRDSWVWKAVNSFRIEVW